MLHLGSSCTGSDELFFSEEFPAQKATSLSHCNPSSPHSLSTDSRDSVSGSLLAGGVYVSMSSVSKNTTGSGGTGGAACRFPLLPSENGGGGVGCGCVSLSSVFLR